MESVSLLPTSSSSSLLLVIFLGQLVAICRGANILYISSVASPSHFLWSQQLFERLAEVGHNVTVVNLYKQGFIRGVHLLKLDGIVDDLSAEENDYVGYGQLNPFEMHVSFAELELHVCEQAMRSHGFIGLMGYPKDFQFQLVIHDHLAGPCLLSFLPRFGYPPLILASAYNRLSTTSSSLGSLIYPGFVPNQVYDIDYPMNFYHRSYNFLISFWEHFFKEFIYYPRVDKLVQEYLNQTESVSSLEKRSLLAILNTDPILDPPEPKLSSIIPAGGLHVKPVKPLPPDLLKILEAATKGFVLLSLGTNVQSDLLDPGILREIIQAMAQLSSLTFLWKLDHEEYLPTKQPPNVFTSSWFPQNDLLAHPNLRLFITHGGLLSIQEAAWHAVPLIGIPIYADQFGNVNQMVRKGIAKRLSLIDLTVEQLVSCIDEVILNKSYKQNAIMLSRLLHDRKESPLDTAIWSIEWVLRNVKTADTWNQPLLLGYSFLEKYSFDVVIALTSTTLWIITLVIIIIAKFVSRSSGRVNKKKTE